MDYKIELEEFVGPMDLLLHLIKKDDVDILKINIEKITKQYLDYINQFKLLNLDIASEYLIMASELIEIKSSLLLPKSKIEEDEYEEDPRENLIKKLLEYKKYKEVTNEFKLLEENRKQIYTKSPSNLDCYKSEEQVINYGDVTVDDLMKAFSKFLERKIDEQPINTKITKREYSVNERSNEIKNILKIKKRILFEELFEIINKEYVVVTFLSILDLAKKGDLDIKQEDNFSKIYLSIKGSE